MRDTHDTKTDDIFQHTQQNSMISIQMGFMRKNQLKKRTSAHIYVNIELSSLLGMAEKNFFNWK